MFNIFKNKGFLCFNADSENAQSKSDMTTKQECGRSMVEMIGVLVLIGLFTIGGVVGYKTAFDTYRATSIMDTVLKGKLAVEADYRVAGKSTLVRAINNGPIADVNDKVEYYTEVACGNRQCKEYVIKTKEPAGVCEKIVLRQSLYNSSDESDNTPEIYITPNNIEDCGEEGEVDMTFTFQIPMLKAGDGSDVYEPVDGTLQESTCPAGQIIIDGVCQCRPACDRGEGVCVCCNTGYEYDNETKSCICPAGTHDTGSDCITCENGTKWDESTKQCENPCTDGKIWNGTTCIDPCSGGKEWDSSVNICVCPEGTNDNGESCVTCSAPKTHWDNELNKCTCPTGFVERNGTCERKPTCTEPRTVYDEASNTCQCPSERPEYDEDKNTCNCPEATPYWDSTNNQCVTCVVGNSNTPVWNGTSCVSCAGADNTKPYWNGTECISCYANNPTTPYWNSTNCTTCPNATPAWNGTACVSCAEADSTKPVWNGTECVACPTETPYWNGTSCVSCYDNNPTTPYWNGTNCTVCPDAKLWNTESNQCVQCLDNENCSGSTPVCNDNNVCESCPDAMPVWHTDMKQCVQCLDNENCSGSTPVCNNSNVCESCPDAMPVWHTDMKQCVQCLENADCPTGTPICNATNACEPCPDETPIWVAETGKCIASDGPSGEGDDECVTNCRWTGWFDNDKPDDTRTGGDVESLENICKGGYIGDISCRSVGFPDTPISEIGQVVLCNTEVGLLCRNQDQTPDKIPTFSCLNYEIAVYCCSKSESCYKCTTSTDCSKEAPYCNNGKCEACPSETPYWDEYQNKCVAEMICEEPACHTNSDCGEGEYCDIACYDDKCTDDSTTMSGRCRVAINDIQVPNEGTTPPFIISKREMFWWSAKNFCQALGTTLVDDVDYNCSDPIIDNLACTSDVDSYSVHLESMIQSYSLKYGGGWTGTSYDSCMVIVMDWPARTIRRYNKTDPKYAVCKNLDLSCEDGMIWHPDLNKCVECTVNLHCNSDKPNCNLETNTCESCPAETPLWNSDKRECAKYVCNNKSYNCQTNSECADDEYCKISCYTESCTKDASQLYGTCEKVKFETPNSGTNPAFVKSSDTMTWWGANNFCQAQGKVMVTLSDFNCAHTICPSGCDAKTGYCHASTSQSVSSSATKDRTQVMQNMYDAYDLSDVWLNSDYNNCESYELSFYSGSIYNSNFYYTNYALCKDRPSCPTETPVWNGTNCVTCAEADNTKPIWNGTECTAGYVCNQKAYECHTNEDCALIYGSGYYCDIECYTEYCKSNTTGIAGSCRNASSDVQTPNSGTNPPFKKANRAMDMWSANNFCESMGWKLTEVSDYNCTPTICANGCESQSGICYSENNTFSENIVTIIRSYGYFWYWTNTAYDSCNPYVISTSAKRILYARDNPKGGVVCKICSGSTPVWNGTTCEACPTETPVWNGINCEACPTETPYWDGSVCVANCPNEKPVAGTNNVCEACPTDKPAWSGTECYNEATAQNCQTAMTSAGFSTANFTMSGVTIKYTGKMTLSKDLDISACNLDVAGTLMVFSGKTLKVNNVKAESSGDDGISNYGTIEATGDVTGTGSYGIDNTGTITATNVTGTGTRGIYNDGTITATNVTGTGTDVTGMGTDAGIDNSGTITATNVTGTGNYGIDNDGSGTITATNVTGTGTGTESYGISNDGTITATGDISGTATGSNGTGIDNTTDSTITATGDVTGTGNNYGIRNWEGTITATNVTGTGAGTGLISYGIYTGSGTITATGDVTGTSSGTGSFAEGIYNWNGTITATNVYYCQTIYNTGQIIGHIQCKCPEGMSCPATTITQCTAPTPVLSGNLTTCVGCAEADSTKPVWNGTTCEACPTETPYWDGSVCVANCPNEKPVAGTNNVCEACPTETPVWNGTTCEACPSETPVWNGTTCVSCAETDSTKPVWNGTACEACPTATPVWNGTTCEACPSDKPIWNGTECTGCSSAKPYLNNGVCVANCPTDTYPDDNNVCVTVTEWCTQQMVNAGYNTTKFSVSSNTITYKTPMTITTELDISKCNLTVEGNLTVNSEKSLNALVVSANSSSAEGVSNAGIIIATELTGRSTTSKYGVNNTGTITVLNGIVTGESKGTHGIYNNADSAQINAKTIVGTNNGTSSSYYGIYITSGTITALETITGTGGSGIYNNGIMMATGATVVGTGNKGYGINCASKAAKINANRIEGTSTSNTGIYNNGGIIDVKDDIIGITASTSSNRYGIYNYSGIINANTITGKSQNFGYGIYNNKNKTYAIITAKTVNYCAKIYNNWVIDGNINCICDDTTKCVALSKECTAPTSAMYSTTGCFNCVETYISQPYWDEVTGMCQACVDINETKPYYNSETGTCTACPADTPYWDGFLCVSTCPSEKPIFNENKICSTCPSKEPYWTGTKCVETCPNGNPIGSYLCNVDETSCSYIMSSAGYTTYYVSGNTVVYEGDMTISNDLNLSACNLVVNGTLVVDKDYQLQVKNITAKNGIINNGNIDSSGDMIGGSPLSKNIVGISNYGTINTGNITGWSIVNSGIYNEGTISASQMTGESRYSYGIDNDESGGIVNLTGNMFGSGRYGIGNGYMIVAQNVTAKGTYSGSSSVYGLYQYSSFAKTTANTISASSKNTAIYNQAGSKIIAKNVSATSESGIAINNGGTIDVSENVNATSATSSTSGDGATLRNVGKLAVITAKNIKGENTGTGRYAIYNCQGILEATENITGFVANRSDSYRSAITNCGSASAYAGHDVIMAKNIYYCDQYWDYGTMIGKISCNCSNSAECKSEGTTCLIPSCTSCEEVFWNKPYWDANSNTCKSCVEINAAKPYWDASLGTCKSCPSATPYWSGSSCESVCPMEKPLYDKNKICQSCPIETPYWDKVNGLCVASCPNGNPDVGFICDPDTTSCSYKLSKAGFNSYEGQLFTVNGNTITYYNGFQLTKSLDLSSCNFIVKGHLDVDNKNTILTVDNLVVYRTIYNDGTIEASTVEAKGIINEDTGVINSSTSVYAKRNGIQNSGKIETITLDGRGNSFFNIGLSNEGSIIATTVIGKGYGEAKGIKVSETGTITATTVTGTSVDSWALLNYGIITATTVTGTGHIGISSSGTITAQTVTATSEAGDGLSNTGTIKATGNVVGRTTYSSNSSTISGVFNRGTIETTNGDIIGNAVAAKYNSGISNSEGAVLKAKNIYYCKTIRNSGTVNVTPIYSCSK